MKKIYLHDGWTLKDQSFAEQLNATVPGCFHTDLINAGKIENIFYRDNAQKYVWLENCAPVYETRFDADVSSNVILKFEGLDTFAEIYLNGVHLGDVHNMFIPHAFDVSAVLKSADNHLRVEFTSPIKAVEGMKIPGGFAFTGDRINARRMQCTYGWDWVDRFVTMGIFRPVYLEYRQGLEIEDVYVHTDAIDDFGASICAEYSFSGTDFAEIVTAEVVSPDGVVVYRDRFFADRALMVRKMDIPTPKLWYPTGYGSQPLYQLKVSVSSSTYETEFGIRTLRILNLQDKPGSAYYEKAKNAKENSVGGKIYCEDEEFFGFKVIVNCTPVFLRGGNWVPCDPFPSEESDEKIKYLLREAKEMGVNILRVWGGGLFEKKVFYDECDRLGILICHDFLMACGEYPESEEWFINELLLESEYAVKFLRNHPSLAWFHGDNENATDGSDILANYTGKRSAYDGIFPSIYKYSKNIPFLTSSPWGGNKFASITSGTTHNTNFIGASFAYRYEHDCSDYKEYLAGFTSRFMSEEPTFGAICRESMLEFMTENDIVGDDESILKYHAKTNPGLPVHIYDYIRDFAEKILGGFDDGEDRYFKMKYLQCEWVRITYELVLRNLGYSNGIIYWMYNDCWPASVGWAFIDYYCRRKPSYYAFKRLAKEVVGSINAQNGEFTISNTSDESRVAKITVRALDMTADFKEIDIFEDTIFVAPYTTETTDLSHMLGDNILLVCDIESDDEVYRSYHKKGKLPLARSEAFTVLSLTDSEITIRANGYLHAVELEGDCRFSDNYFVMLEGETRKIRFDSFNGKLSGVKVNGYTIRHTGVC